MTKENRAADIAARLKAAWRSTMSWVSSITIWTQIGFLWIVLKVTKIFELCACGVTRATRWLKPKCEKRLAALQVKTNQSPRENGPAESSAVEGSTNEETESSDKVEADSQ